MDGGQGADAPMTVDSQRYPVKRAVQDHLRAGPNPGRAGARRVHRGAVGDRPVPGDGRVAHRVAGPHGVSSGQLAREPAAALCLGQRRLQQQRPGACRLSPADRIAGLRRRRARRAGRRAACAGRRLQGRDGGFADARGHRVGHARDGARRRRVFSAASTYRASPSADTAAADCRRSRSRTTRASIRRWC
jgi:hypothetical protein